MNKKYLSILAGFIALATASARADVPRTIAFQGTLKDAASKPITTSRPVTFTLYDALTEGNTVWTETKDIAPDASGLFATSLGSVTPLTSVTFDKPYWVGVKVGNDIEMTPRFPLMSAPYALGLPGVVAAGREIGINATPDSALTIKPSQELDWISFKDKSGVSKWHLNNMGAGVNLAETGVADGRIYVAPGGNVGIGTASPTYKLQVEGACCFSLAPAGGGQLVFSNNPGDNRIFLEGFSADGSGSAGAITFCGKFGDPLPDFIITANHTTVNGVLSVNGGAQAQTLTLTSSRRFKEGIQPIKNALSTIERLQGVAYNWDQAHGGKKDLGFVAEDAAKVVPELVTMEPDGKNAVGMDYSHLTALTVEAIKQLKAENNAKDAQIRALTARLDRLERVSKPATRKESH